MLAWIRSGREVEPGGGRSCVLISTLAGNPGVDVTGVSAVREEEVESRWEAAPAVVVVMGLQLLLALVSRHERWKFWGLPWWVWLVSIAPELVLLVPLAFRRPRHQLEQLGRRRMTAVGLLGVVSAANALALVALIGSLLSGQERSGPGFC